MSKTMKMSFKISPPSQEFVLQADIEDNVTCRVYTRDGCSLKEAFAAKIENTGGRKWYNFLVFVKQTGVPLEWEINASCARGHRLLILNKLDTIPQPLLGTHHFLVHPDMINLAAAPYTDKDFYYILRPSLQSPGSYALAITTPSEPNGSSVLRHVKIKFDPERETYSLCSREFDSLDKLITFFKTTPIKAHNGPNMPLRHPVPVNTELEEDCKKRFRLTRSGSRVDVGQIEHDRVSLWSNSSISATPTFTPSPQPSYDSDEERSGVSSSASSVSPENLSRPLSVMSRNSRTSTVTSLLDNKIMELDTDIVMRGMSNSSNSTSTSSESNQTGLFKNKISSTIFKRQGAVPSRPKSEVLRPRSSLVTQNQLTARCQTYSCNETEGGYVDMEILKGKAKLKEFSGGNHGNNDNTLTRMDCPSEETYVQMSMTPSFTPEPTSNYETMQSPRPSFNDQARPDVQSVTDTTDDRCHSYVNHNAVTPPPPAPLSRISSDSRLSDHQYQNLLDRSTNEKLVANVRVLMDTVQKQSEDIRTLKETVRDLRIKIQHLESLDHSGYESGPEYCID